MLNFLSPCIAYQVMGMDSKKVICAISAMDYFYVFDCLYSISTNPPPPSTQSEGLSPRGRDSIGGDTEASVQTSASRSDAPMRWVRHRRHSLDSTGGEEQVHCIACMTNVPTSYFAPGPPTLFPSFLLSFLLSFFLSRCFACLGERSLHC
jgi:hypothetical protein